ncbi:MAG: NAD(P)/FAD-dependent oxidoreductase [Acidimicrobiia bacterium]|nr:NAD(P)/FAD-dependent oxidoreductase [Acidimicrobiia bacterium]
MSTAQEEERVGLGPVPGTKDRKPQDFYEEVKEKFAQERDLRLDYRPDGTRQYITELEGELARYEIDPYAAETVERAPISDEVEVLFIGSGFSALLTSARLREVGVESIRMVERGADVGGTWYWNRYPGVACDVVAYDYLPLLDETGYIPTRHYASGQEIYQYCQLIAQRYNLYELALFQTTVTRTEWNADEKRWHVHTDRGDHMRAQFVVCANGTLSKPKLARIEGMELFKGHSFHTSRWDYEYTGADLENLHDKVVGIIGTGASAVQAIPNLGVAAKELYVFQRTPSTIEVKKDWETDQEWAAKLEPGWQAQRRQKVLQVFEPTEEQKARYATMTPEEKLRRQENANIDLMMSIHRHIDETVEDPQTAESLKPWYMYFCKRPCFHNEYLPTFNRPNVHLVDTHGRGITEIAEGGPVFDGKVYEVDLLIYATGFEVQKTGIYNQILGEGGLEINDHYRDGVRTLLGIHTHGYPNLFIMGGYQASFQFNLTDMLQQQGDHIAACIDMVRKGGHTTLDVTHESEEWWVQEVIKHRGKTNRNAECTPGYYNFEGEFNRRQDGNYNGGFRQYVDHMLDIRANLADHFTLS